MLLHVRWCPRPIQQGYLQKLKKELGKPQTSHGDHCCCFKRVHSHVAVTQTPFHCPHSTVHDFMSWHHQPRRHRDSTQEFLTDRWRWESSTNHLGSALTNGVTVGKSQFSDFRLLRLKCGHGISYLWGPSGSFCSAALEPFIPGGPFIDHPPQH